MAGLELDPAERQASWDAAGQAIGRADEELRAAAGGDPAVRAMAEAAAVAASEVLAAVGRLTERSWAGPLHRAAEVHDRAARGLRGMEFVRTADTRQLLHTLDQLNRLSHTLAGLREQQGRAAQAAAARQAAELIGAEQTRRAHAAHAAVVRGRTFQPERAQTTGRPAQAYSRHHSAGPAARPPRHRQAVPA